MPNTWYVVDIVRVLEMSRVVSGSTWLEYLSSGPVCSVSSYLWLLADIYPELSHPNIEL